MLPLLVATFAGAGCSTESAVRTSLLAVTAGKEPVPVAGGGRTILAYEIYVRNSDSERGATLNGLKVFLGDQSVPVADYASADVQRRLRILEGDTASPQDGWLPPDSLAIVFLWIESDRWPTPDEPRHEVTFRLDGAQEKGTASRLILPVSSERPIEIGPPLRGDLWFAANGPSFDSVHRRAVLADGDEWKIAQRFAVDFMRFQQDGRMFDGEGKDNARWLTYGAEALAVADAVVADTHDGLPDNVPMTIAVKPTLDAPETYIGNSVVLDLGQERYALYG